MTTARLCRTDDMQWAYTVTAGCGLPRGFGTLLQAMAHAAECVKRGWFPVDLIDERRGVRWTAGTP